nr:uncharacterized protein LOC109186981 [Ipomoea batatas]
MYVIYKLSIINVRFREKIKLFKGDEERSVCFLSEWKGAMWLCALSHMISYQASTVTILMMTNSAPTWLDLSGEAVRDRQQLVKQPDNELSTGRKVLHKNSFYYAFLIAVWDLLITWGTLPVANGIALILQDKEIVIYKSLIPTPPIIIHLPRGSPGPSPSITSFFTIYSCSVLSS